MNCDCRSRASTPLLKMARQPVSLDAPVGDDGDVSVGDFIEDKRAENPSAGTSKSMLKEKLGHVLALLNRAGTKDPRNALWPGRWLRPHA